MSYIRLPVTGTELADENFLTTLVRNVRTAAQCDNCTSNIIFTNPECPNHGEPCRECMEALVNNARKETGL